MNNCQIYSPNRTTLMPSECKSADIDLNLSHRSAYGIKVDLHSRVNDKYTPDKPINYLLRAYGSKTMNGLSDRI